MKAVIVAGGKATRLRPLTYSIPKALVPIRGKPIVERQIELLKRYGIREVIMCTGYLHGRVERYFGDGSRFGVKISYRRERKLLGTGGAIKNAENLIDGTFIVIYGDIMAKMNLKRLIDFHKRKGALATIVSHESDHPYDSDLIRVDESGRVAAFIGKPDRDKPLPTRLTIASIYVLEPAVLGFIPKAKNSFEDDILPKLIRSGKVYGFITNEYVKDMGTPERLIAVGRALAERKKL